MGYENNRDVLALAVDEPATTLRQAAAQRRWCLIAPVSRRDALLHVRLHPPVTALVQVTESDLAQSLALAQTLRHRCRHLPVLAWSPETMRCLESAARQAGVTAFATGESGLDLLHELTLAHRTQRRLACSHGPPLAIRA